MPKSISLFLKSNFTVLFQYSILQTTKRHLDQQIPQSSESCEATRETRVGFCLFKFNNNDWLVGRFIGWLAAWLLDRFFGFWVDSLVG